MRLVLLFFLPTICFSQNVKFSVEPQIKIGYAWEQITGKRSDDSKIDIKREGMIYGTGVTTHLLINSFDLGLGYVFSHQINERPPDAFHVMKIQIGYKISRDKFFIMPKAFLGTWLSKNDYQNPLEYGLGAQLGWQLNNRFALTLNNDLYKYKIQLIGNNTGIKSVVSEISSSFGINWIFN